MGVYVENRSIQCLYCGYNPIMGREQNYNDKQGNTIHECRWVCPRCLRCVRVDENVIKKQPSPPKQKSEEDETK